MFFNHRFLASSVTSSVITLGVLSLAQASSSGLIVPENEVPEGKKGSAVYIVQLRDDPVVSYAGGVAGLSATQSIWQKRQKASNKRKVQKYVNHLSNQHDAALQKVNASDQKVYDYHYAFNGFAAELSPGQAASLAKQKEVISVQADSLQQLHTDNTPTFLGINSVSPNAIEGIWKQLGGVEKAGEDVIVGVIDTGIWPEHPSFSDQVDLTDAPGKSGRDTLAYGPPPAHWQGICQSGELWSQDDCNNKLIGARYFVEGFSRQGILPEEYLSARDRDGHGTHTASTAAGNYGVMPEIFSNSFPFASGVAPRARIAAYKACWNDQGCFNSDLTAAIDQAVADGVDVINYSIGSSGLNLDPTSIAFLFAANEGVFVATSNGNSGPGAETVGTPAWVPWVTSVGASTQDRTYQGSVQLGNNAEYFGASITNGTEVLPLVDAEDAGSPLCIPGELDSAVVQEKIVLCERGQIARVDKSLAVSLAGGLGMVLYNNSDSQSQVTDSHHVPSVHINNTDGLAIKSYLERAGDEATAKIGGGVFTQIDAPWMAAFSSRGPNGGAYDIIKPDVTAPGVNILAGHTPTPWRGAPEQLFQVISGTSMSSPHVAGIGALLKQAHPTWTPAMLKSAVMTTAYQYVKKEDGMMPAAPFDMGAGHVDPNFALAPGLAYDANFYDYIGFLCGIKSRVVSEETCQQFGIDPSDLNLASIGISDLAGLQTVKRVVTNVGPAGTYKVFVEAPTGIKVAVNPSSLTLDTGESASYQVTFKVTKRAALNEWVFGSLIWYDSYMVRSPIAVRPIILAAPEEVSGSGITGSTSYDVTFGYNGNFNVQVVGLLAALTENKKVVDDPANDINEALRTGVGITLHQVTVPVGTQYARFSLFNDYTDGDDDLDLYIFGPTGNFVGGSGSGTSAEEVNVVAPAAGNYTVVVHGWQTDGADSNYTLFSWALTDDLGNMTVTTPSTAELGTTEPVTVQWYDLEENIKYLGALNYYNGGSQLPPITTILVSTE